MKIIVADDQANMRNYIKKLLNELGYENLLFAENGNEAFSLLESNVDTSVVLSDFKMPEFNGLELLKKIRASEVKYIKNVHYISVTAEGDKTSILDILHAGANGYLIKPFSKDQLQEKILEYQG